MKWLATLLLRTLKQLVELDRKTSLYPRTGTRVK